MHGLGKADAQLTALNRVTGWKECPGICSWPAPFSPLLHSALPRALSVPMGSLGGCARGQRGRREAELAEGGPGAAQSHLCPECPPVLSSFSKEAQRTHGLEEEPGTVLVRKERAVSPRAGDFRPGRVETPLKEGHTGAGLLSADAANERAGHCLPASCTAAGLGHRKASGHIADICQILPELSSAWTCPCTGQCRAQGGQEGASAECKVKEQRPRGRHSEPALPPGSREL